MNSSLPNPEICQTRKLPDACLYYCRALTSFPSLCHYSMTFGDDLLCLHPGNHQYVR
ncbi:hypothetical protein KI809_17780 [Geobacter pelophilus]|uniref:Uncharacterized protein n=1 Tax=Geoanaerobacter pelophilus TaxID=60036 RepID=A0AAW4L8I5_9BACT|nr:hypothetical protein [Geoanaerobacter pelophilus]MBT0666165.1 hypothetical protein [Geoanaerobacter pelophilus]